MKIPVVCLLLFMMLAACSSGQYVTATPRRLHKAMGKGYTTVVNNDTLASDTLFLDKDEYRNVRIDKSRKTVYITTHNTLISIAELKERYKRDSVALGCVVFKGLAFLNGKKVYIQQSLIKDTLLLRREKIAETTLFCSPPRGDVLIIN
ncbi:hypothetical protein ACLI1A_13160 [Flavobacterium sp. RHBU_3]|uniref:hypothetical protein n=1 Tax=Flavobacterium sp. RHBU_3 TaxID=3391184 RepID=UPI003984FBD6